MRKTETPVSVRLEPELAKALKSLAERLDVPVGKLIKWAVSGMVEKAEKEKGLRLPFKF